MKIVNIPEKTYVCVKCGKMKKESEGSFLHDGAAYCCKVCCGDPAKGEHTKKASAVCEFC